MQEMGTNATRIASGSQLAAILMIKLQIINSMKSNLNHSLLEELMCTLKNQKVTIKLPP